MFHNSVFDETNSSVIQSNLHDQSGAVDFLRIFCNYFGQQDLLIKTYSELARREDKIWPFSLYLKEIYFVTLHLLNSQRLQFCIIKSKFQCPTEEKIWPDLVGGGKLFVQLKVATSSVKKLRIKHLLREGMY